MEMREHKGFAHGLRPGTRSDINCPSCIREDNMHPMTKEEMNSGRYVCVARGGCIHTPNITVYKNGVWVRYPDSNNPGSRVYSSAHRDCYEAGDDACNHSHRRSIAGRKPIDQELFDRTAPRWNCVDYPNDGMHYVNSIGSCYWCGKTKEQIAEEKS